MKHEYAYEEAKVRDRPPEIEMRADNNGEDFWRVGVGIVECRRRHGHTKNPVGDRVCLVLEREGTFCSGGEEGQDEETVPVGKDDVLLTTKGKPHDYDGRMRLFLSDSPAYEQDSDVRHDDLWG